MNIKKLLKVLGIIFIILLILTITYLLIIHFDGFLNKDNPMTREEVISLLEKGKEYPNYYYCSTSKILFAPIDKNFKTEYYIKDNIEKIIVNGQPHDWNNFETREYISTSEYNGKKIALIGNLDTEHSETKEVNQHGFDYSLLTNEDTFNTDFKYLGEKDINGRNTIVVKLCSKNNLNVNVRYYIDKETGLMMGRTDYIALGFIRVDCDRNVKLDIVTDKDVERPNLDGYEIPNRNLN